MWRRGRQSFRPRRGRKWRRRRWLFPIPGRTQKPDLERANDGQEGAKLSRSVGRSAEWRRKQPQKTSVRKKEEKGDRAKTHCLGGGEGWKPLTEEEVEGEWFASSSPSPAIVHEDMRWK